MSWFYIGNKDHNESRMTYKVIHEFTQMKTVGNPLAGEPMQQAAIPTHAVDMETKNRNEARARVNFLNGGAGDFPGQITDSDNEVIDNG